MGFQAYAGEHRQVGPTQQKAVMKNERALPTALPERHERRIDCRLSDVGTHDGNSGRLAAGRAGGGGCDEDEAKLTLTLTREPSSAAESGKKKNRQNKEIQHLRMSFCHVPAMARAPVI